MKVIVAMSGGVDSSVAAALLVEQGYEVTGIMLRLWQEAGDTLTNRCCTPDAMALARKVAAKLNIPFYAIDAQEEFRNIVVEYFINGYAKGVTPNPCLACNRHIRWGFLHDRVLAMGADYLATGHYARIRHNGKYQLLRAIDLGKDQSYVLHILNQDLLSRTKLPIGDYSKYEVRELAKKFNLPVADRKDSQDLCFLGESDYRSFLLRHAPETIKPGPILNMQKQEIGEHKGLAFYTIGQRKGLGVYASQRFYVIEKDQQHNTITVGLKEEMGHSELITEEVNWISGSVPEDAFQAKIKTRYTSAIVSGLVNPISNNRVLIKFEKPIFDITPGQAAVIYVDDICLGGGIISSMMPISIQDR